MSSCLWPHESQHARTPCPSPTPRVYSNSCPSSQWCHPAISSSVVPFSSCPQSLPASGSSPMSQLFAWGGQSIGVSASASVLPMNTQDGSPLGWTGWISLQSKGLSRALSNTTIQKHQFFSAQLSWFTLGYTWYQNPKKMWQNLKVLISCVQLFATPWTVAHQVSLSMGFSRQEYWSGLPFPSPGGSSRPRDWTCISCIGRWSLYYLSHQGSPKSKKFKKQKRTLLHTSLSYKHICEKEKSRFWH